MKAKSILSIVLLVFVGISLVYLIIDRTGSTPAADAGNAAAVDEQLRQVKAYYFHATKRCRTCLEIERLADETVTTQFGNELEAGGLTWEIINFESPGDEHFVDDYDLMYSSLILAEYENGRQVSWKNLDQVWDLVWKPEDFAAYVAGEIRSHLDESRDANPAADENL